MSITIAQNTAVSALALVSRETGVVSSNIANALDETHARRELETAARADGGMDPQASRIKRVVDTALVGDLRLANADRESVATRADGLERLESIIGAPGSGLGVVDAITALEEALASASSRPDSDVRLSGVRDAAVSLADRFTRAAGEIQDLRLEADRSIVRGVDQANAALERVADLNAQISVASATRRDTSALLDRRQAQIDDLARLIPVRELPRDNNQIALVTPSGATLLDGTRPSYLGFDAAPVVSAQMSLASGALSGLELDGKPVSTGPEGRLMGGALGAQFALRDDLAASAATNLDALARDVVERFESPEADATRPVGAPGLFTDDGAALDPATETGLAGRLRVNAMVDPAQGGAEWRLRTGLGAAAPGPVGDARGLQALEQAIQTPRVPHSGTITNSARDLPQLAADMLSRVGTARIGLEAEQASRAARADMLQEARLQGGVDTDAELQRLLQLEQAFAANSRVLRAADEMMRTVLEVAR